MLNGGVDLIHTRILLVGCRCNILNECRGLLDIRNQFLQHAACLFGNADGGGGQFADFCSSDPRTLCQLAHFGSDNSEALAMLTRSGRFDCRVQGKEVGLACNLFNDRNLFRNLGHGRDCLGHGFARLLGIECSLGSDLFSLYCVFRIPLNVGGHLFHRRGDLFHAGGLFCGALGQRLRGCGQFFAAGSHVFGGSTDFTNDPAQLITHALQSGCKTTDFVFLVDLNRLGQITMGKAFGQRNTLDDRRNSQTGNGPEHTHKDENGNDCNGSGHNGKGVTLRPNGFHGNDDSKAPWRGGPTDGDRLHRIKQFTAIEFTGEGHALLAGDGITNRAPVFRTQIFTDLLPLKLVVGVGHKNAFMGHQKSIPDAKRLDLLDGFLKIVEVEINTDHADIAPVLFNRHPGGGNPICRAVHIPRVRLGDRFTVACHGSLEPRLALKVGLPYVTGGYGVVLAVIPVAVCAFVCVEIFFFAIVEPTAGEGTPCSGQFVVTLQHLDKHAVQQFTVRNGLIVGGLLENGSHGPGDGHGQIHGVGHFLAEALGHVPCRCLGLLSGHILCFHGHHDRTGTHHDCDNDGCRQQQFESKTPVLETNHTISPDCNP